MTNELNNLPVKINLPQGNNYRDKDTPSHFLTESRFFRRLMTPTALGSDFFEGLILLGISENNSNDLKFESEQR